MLSEENRMLLAEGSFARHETFCPRYGWLKKGVDGVASDERIFDRDDAIETLGVGKNMVRSIKFWCLAFKLIEPADGPKKPGGPMKATEFAKMLFADDGIDPYLEDPASLWLLHWRLFTPPILAPAWSMAVNSTDVRVFGIRELKDRFLEYREFIPSFQRLSESSFEKDASCFIRMYGPQSGRLEEIESPFTQLDLLSKSEKKGAYRFNVDEKPRLPDLILLAACFDYAEKFHRNSNVLSLNAIAYGFNSPGVAFKLSETDLGHRLERATADFEGAVFAESYGDRQLMMESPPEELHGKALSRYYRNNRKTGL